MGSRMARQPLRNRGSRLRSAGIRWAQCPPGFPARTDSRRARHARHRACSGTNRPWSCAPRLDREPYFRARRPCSRFLPAFESKPSRLSHQLRGRSQSRVRHRSSRGRCVPTCRSFRGSFGDRRSPQRGSSGRSPAWPRRAAVEPSASFWRSPSPLPRSGCLRGSTCGRSPTTRRRRRRHSRQQPPEDPTRRRRSICKPVAHCPHVGRRLPDAEPFSPGPYSSVSAPSGSHMPRRMPYSGAA
jgi:hypothetical protein